MKKIFMLIVAVMMVAFAYSQKTEQVTTAEEAEELFDEWSDNMDNWEFYCDSIESTLKYEHGTIELTNGVAKLVLPTGYKFLNAQQAQYVLSELWGNPEDESVLGLILPEKQSIFGDNTYVYEVYYLETGYVKDDDADKIDYDDLLKDLKEETNAENKQRKELGYDPITLVNWAAKPYYDKNKKVLHWAKELKFGEQEINTLNYNIRFLGRKGVLVVNAIADMTDLPAVEQDIPIIIDVVHFNDGYAYKDFDISIDDVAPWTIGGLVAGKILAKAGFFALLLKFWKIIAVVFVGFFGAFWKKIRNKSSKKNETIEKTKEKDDVEYSEDEITEDK